MSSEGKILKWQDDQPRDALREPVACLQLPQAAKPRLTPLSLHRRPMKDFTGEPARRNKSNQILRQVWHTTGNLPHCSLSAKFCRLSRKSYSASQKVMHMYE